MVENNQMESRCLNVLKQKHFCDYFIPTLLLIVYFCFRQERARMLMRLVYGKIHPFRVTSSCLIQGCVLIFFTDGSVGVVYFMGIV